MLIPLFGVSALLLTSILLIKIIEEKIKRKLLVSSFLHSFDAVVMGRTESCRSFVENLSERVVNFIRYEIPRQGKYTFFAVKKIGVERYEKMILSVRGIRSIRSDREASTYLQDIFKHKKENGIGTVPEDTTYPQNPKSDV
jgi:hypothetical protein